MTSHHDPGRRRLITLGFVAGGAAAVGGMAGVRALFPPGDQSSIALAPSASTPPVGSPASGSVSPHLWSDPTTWGGSVPAPGASVVVEQPVLLDIDADVGALTVSPTGAVSFEPGSTRTLNAHGNVVVHGLLEMRPDSPEVTHVLRFVDVDEEAFQGGGMDPVESDIGLWCMGEGLLDVAGAPKTPWIRLERDATAGTRQLVLAADPEGWQVGDELVIVPSGPSGHDAYDQARVVSISGQAVELDRPIEFDHPIVEVGPDFALAPEVLNLTRNVVIEGSKGGRSHIFVRSSRPQTMKYFTKRWMGPRQNAGDAPAAVLGRYGLHFHMAGDASRGSRVVGAVNRDAGGHAFVAHGSHGVTFEACISHDTYDDPYWWDGAPDTRTPAPDSHDIEYLGCVASRVKAEPANRGFRLAGFVLGAGSGNRAIDCVAVGVQGNRDASGFHWPEGPTSGVWDFQRCVAHNNARHGIFTWQNTPNDHVVEDFICAHNGGAGIAHGAYLNSYLYVNGFLYGNALSAIDLHSNSHEAGPQRFARLHCDGMGAYDRGVRVLRHVLEPATATEFVSCRFQGQQLAAIGVVHDAENEPTTIELLDLIECRSSEPLIRLHESTIEGSRVRVQQGRQALVARPYGAAGEPRPDWNAVVEAIAPFSDEPHELEAVPFSLPASPAVVTA